MTKCITASQVMYQDRHYNSDQTLGRTFAPHYSPIQVSSHQHGLDGRQKHGRKHLPVSMNMFANEKSYSSGSDSGSDIQQAQASHSLTVSRFDRRFGCGRRNVYRRSMQRSRLCDVHLSVQQRTPRTVTADVIEDRQRRQLGNEYSRLSRSHGVNIQQSHTHACRKSTQCRSQP